ncbi:MAG: transporter substrate-binding domain-containing protein [Pseudobdellovibrionaceae bacterium]|nr:transporter substrate-binding domain-containing protein [Pseudobdellovibrionaceae bacterium]
MLKWSLITISWLLSQLCLAADTSKNLPGLNFEISVNPDTEMGRVVTGALTKVVQDLGYGLQITSYPPKRGLMELKAGRVDGSVGRAGNFNTVLGSKDFVRIDFPIVVFRISRWCRVDRDKSKPKIHVGLGLGYLLMKLLMDHMDSGRVEIQTLTDQKAGIQMLKAGRLDCVLSNDLIMETQGLSSNDLKDFERFDLMTIEAFPWIAKRHEHLKAGIEAGLKAYPFPEAFRKKFQDLSPACEGTLSVLCPDGAIFTKRLDFR